MIGPGEASGTEDRVAVARAVLAAYEAKDRDALERLVAEDFSFTSPLDNHLDRATYFERCWPTSAALARFDVLRCLSAGDEVIVTYEAHATDGRAFRNTEVLTVRDGRLLRVEVYFGWDLPHKAPPGGSVPA